MKLSISKLFLSVQFKTNSWMVHVLYLLSIIFMYCYVITGYGIWYIYMYTCLKQPVFIIFKTWHWYGLYIYQFINFLFIWKKCFSLDKPWILYDLLFFANDCIWPKAVLILLIVECISTYIMLHVYISQSWMGSNMYKFVFAYIWNLRICIWLFEKACIFSRLQYQCMWSIWTNIIQILLFSQI